jgi:hypothetical protein
MQPSQPFLSDAFIDAVFTLGDRFGEVQAIAIHSVVYARLVKLDHIEFIPDSNGKMSIPTYQGKIVIVDDGMPVVAGSGNGYKFYSIIFGGAVVGYGEGTPRVPVELYREPLKGNGAGIETIIERKTMMLHAHGFSFISGAVVGQSATNAELATAANWDRVIDRKSIPLAFLVTNG